MLKGLFVDVTPEERSAITRQAAAIGASVTPFGLAFGVLCTQANFRWFHAFGMSALVFTGGTQFAAVGVLKDGGSATAAIAAGLLLSLRSLVYGLTMAPSLRGSFLFRAASAQLMIDESVAVGAGQTRPVARRAGYLAAGLSVFGFWNMSTMIGFLLIGSNADFTRRFGLDATVPAAFAALVWPRLKDLKQRSVVLIGALIAFVLIPVVPAGMPIIAASLAVPMVLVARARAAQVPTPESGSLAEGSLSTRAPVEP